MSACPIWLADMACVNPWTVNTFNELYAIFARDLLQTPHPVLGGQRVVISRKCDGEKEELFWHLTQKDDGNGQRTPDLRRCERLPWIRCMFDHSTEPELLVWDFQESNKAIRTYIWLRDHNFVIVCQKLRRSYVLITAFYVEKAGYRRSLESRYKRRIV